MNSDLANHQTNVPCDQPTLGSLLASGSQHTLAHDHTEAGTLDTRLAELSVDCVAPPVCAQSIYCGFERFRDRSERY